MKITISKSELLGAIKSPARISSKALEDYLSCLLIAAKGDSITVTGMDFVESVRVSAPAFVDEEGTALISANSLMVIVKTLPDAAVELQADASGAVISCGKSKFDIPALDPILFPSFPEVAPDEEVSIPADTFSFLSSVGGSFASSNEKAMSVLRCVHVRVFDGVAHFVSTDSYRIVEASSAIDGAGSFEANIPASFVNAISPSGSSVVIGTSSNQIVVTTGSAVYVTRTVSGKFPNYEPLMQLSATAEASFDASMLIGAVKRAKAIANNGDAVELSVRDDDVCIALTGGRGCMVDAVEADTTGECVLYVNLAYLANALMNVKDGRVTVEIESPVKPLAINGDGVRMVVMPVRRP